MTPHTVVTASAHWAQAPLDRPYGLSFGTLHAFDLILVRLVDSSGQVGFGESCPVPPYSRESAEQVWAAVVDVLPGLCGQDVRAAAEDLSARADSLESFSYVAPSTACEALVAPPPNGSALKVPVVGAVLTHDVERLPDEVRRLIDLGHRTLKVKVGFDPMDDLEQIKIIKDCLPDGVRLRLDANEAWDLAQAMTFLTGLEPDGIELLEQPFPRDRWDWVTTLKGGNREIPLMLDESIHGEQSIRRAAECGADIIKLKLMKVGSRAALRRRTRFAQSLGLSVVIGNGIAGVVDNWYEALCVSDTGRAGEMNGNLKLTDAVLDQRPWLEAGELCFPAGFRLSVDEGSLSRQSRQTVQFT